MNDESRLTQVGLFDARVPRYTSYPTAPHFARTVDGTRFGDWIEAIEPGAQISLYLHVPFCRRLCWFCACHTQGTSSDTPVLAYAKVLRAEIAMLKARLAPGVRLSRLHWGGGTPTLMPPEIIADLAATIFDAVPMGAGAEFSVEIDPSEIDDARLDALAAAGMNRASIGVQDFDPKIQATIGREQSYALTRDTIAGIRARGVKSLNTDILYGLPHQTPARIADSVEKLLSLAPDRVALYGYAHVPWVAKRQVMIPTETIPRPERRLELFETARALFLRDGYAEIGIDHFAHPGDGLAEAQGAGRLRRNFQGYTDDGAAVLVGLGASSISRFPQGYAQNAPATAAHTKAIREGRFSTTRGHVFTDDDRLRGRIIEALMCDFRVETADLAARFTLDRAAVARMYHDAARAFPGLLEASDDHLAIPEAARPLTRMIAHRFDAYGLSPSGHSPAI